MKFSSFIQELKEMEAGVNRDCFFYRWKYKFFPNSGLFSTLHGGDVTGSFLRAIKTGYKLPEFIIINGKRFPMEYEINFNRFVETFRIALEAEK